MWWDAVISWRETRLFAGRGVRRFSRSAPLVISALIFPIIMLFSQVVAFSSVAGAAFGGHYAQHLAPLVMLTTASFAAAGTAAGLHSDLHSALLGRLRTMPVRPMSLLAGRVLGDLVRVLAIGILAAAAAQLVGFRFRTGLLALIAFFCVFLLFGCMVTWLAVAIAVYSRSTSQIQLLLRNPTTLLYLLSTGFVPLAAFPALLRPAVQANPMSVFTQSLVGLSYGGPIAGQLAAAVGWAVAVSLGCAVAAVLRYRKLTG
ncbi:MAG: ABC transporter permease [Streptosporangiaceae bacterium]